MSIISTDLQRNCNAGWGFTPIRPLLVILMVIFVVVPPSVSIPRLIATRHMTLLIGIPTLRMLGPTMPDEQALLRPLLYILRIIVCLL
jgi:hypothetical protein